MAPEHTLPNDFESRVKTFGKAIFAEIGKEQPSAFNKNYWAGRIMEWSMTRPEFKINMFRLVDVLPALKSSSSIARHVNEYLGSVGAGIHGLLEWGLNSNPDGLKAKATSLFVKRGVQQMASLFIAGEGPRDALKPLRRVRKDRLSFTVDLLGEFSVSEKEAEHYVERYLEALDVLGRETPRWPESKPILEGHPGERSPVCVSVKLTALYSQCSALNFDLSVEVLSSKLSRIVRKAKEVGAQIYLDAEDSANNEIIYAVFKNVFGSQEFRDFHYPGIVLQAYTLSSEATLRDLLQFARTRGSPIAVRLVKGAYWDQETVLCAQNHWPSPLFAKKESTDAQFEKLSRVLIDNAEFCLPAFGSHNIRSLAQACTYAEFKGLSPKDFELQMLFGMAEPIARAFASRGFVTRLYVPLGDMIVGMGYLVRRLLENTSNESFLRHTFYDAGDIERLLARPEMNEKLSN